jgi:DNA-binding SARP family transcriptional activator/tetratricopeptide (TPR) repeat protein
VAHLSLAVLGPFRATLDGEFVVQAAGRQQALLAYLAVEAERAHSREALARLLWPERPDREALTALRYALSNLRRALHDRQASRPFLLITRYTVQFNRASDHWLDVAAFLDAVDCPGADLDGLTRGMALYRGSFLGDVAVAESPAFEEWALLRREQFHRQAVITLQRLAARHELRGDLEQAAARTRQHLVLEPWDEAAHRRLMRLLALGGQRSAALAHYKACCHVLARELGVEPADDTTALYERIRSGEVVHVAVGQPASPPPYPRATIPSAPFVAREQELSRLDRFLKLALTGQGRVVFVSGEAGSGKTALIDQFARRAMERHSDVAMAGGRCSAHGGIGDPYLPFREILQMLTGDIEAGQAGGAITAEHARRLWAVFPDAVHAVVNEGPELIDRYLPGQALALRAEAFAPGGALWQTRLEELSKRREARADPADPLQVDLFEQVTRVLQNLARRYPLILVLDDLQWADSGTLSLLFHLGRRLRGQRILIVGAYRPADLAPGQNGERHPLEPILHELQRDLGEVQVDLDQADGRGFVEAFLDTEPNRLDRAFRETLYQRTKGHPLFTVELVRGLVDRGDLVQDETGQWAEGPALDWAVLPARVEAVIAGRFGRLPADWRQMLAVASVEGETFTAEVVARVQGADDRQVFRWLSGPLSKQYRLVTAHSRRRVDRRRLSRYAFRHILFRDYLYRSLDEVERARLHEAVGKELEALYAEQVGEISAQLARHFEAAGMIPQAVDYLFQAGNGAVRLSANEAAIACLTRALELLETLPETPGRDRQEFALRLALYAPLTATRGYACPELARSNARAHELSLRQGEAEHLIPALILLSGFYSFRAEFQTAMDLAGRALMLAEQAGAPGHIVWATQVLGMTRMYRGDLVAAREYLEQTLRFDDSHHKAMVPVRGIDPRVAYTSFAAWVVWFLGYPNQAQQLSEEGFCLAQEADHLPSLSMALCVGRIVPRVFCREYGAIPALVEAYAQLAAGHRLGPSQAGARIAGGRALVHHGHAQAGIAEMQQGLADWQATGTKAWAPMYLGMLADAYLEASQLEQAQSALDKAFTAVQQSGERMVEAELHRLQGEVLLAQAEEDEAESRFRQAVEVARHQHARSWELRATMSLARLLSQQGYVKEAHRKLADIYGWFAEGFDTPDLQEAWALLRDLAPERES